MPATSRIHKYNLLMQKRVRSVLLVSTAYDAFVLQEEGNLTEQIFLEYKALSLSSAPHFTHAPTEEAALQIIERERFDLVLRLCRVADTDLGAFGRRVKQLRPDLPVVVLGFDHAEMSRLREMVSRSEIDSIFLWSGDAKILLAIVKEAEDRANLDRDIAVADLRVILVVEDSIRYYSAFLTALYPELMKQSQALFAEGTNRLDKLLRMRTRPKVLHATSYEEALGIYEKYSDNLLGLITDIGFSRGGKLDAEAGLRLAQRMRHDIPDLPIVLQSADEKYARLAGEIGLFVNKNSPALLQQVRSFLIEYLGFGDFIFRLPDGTEVARARDLREFSECLSRVPPESLAYHAGRNHISNWLLARSEFDLAAKLRPQKASDFPSLESVREYLLEELGKLRRTEQAGVITDFSRRHFDPDSLFQRIGDGMLGGKGRGLAFMNHLLTEAAPQGSLAGMEVRIPQTFVLTTDAFDQFVEENRLRRLAEGRAGDGEIREQFLAGRLSPEAEANLRVILEHLAGPLAVRSSSLLEDDMLHPFAGVYETLMLPNDAAEPSERLSRLCRAVKMVYASTYLQNARAYLRHTSNRVEEEKMAVVVQRLVGQRFGGRFYPHFSGVAQSYNFYPLPPLKASEGVALLALGLGRMVVDGGECLRFSPRHPEVIPHFAKPTEALKHSQRSFYALDMDDRRPEQAASYGDNLRRYPLEAAAEDGTLQLVASTYDAADDAIKDSPGASGPSVLTFNNLLKYGAIPLAPALDQLLRLATAGMGTAVEIEFAGDLGDFGRARQGGGPARPPILYVLQLRPVLAREAFKPLPGLELRPDRLICRSTSSLGHGRHRTIRDLIYVRPESFDPSRNSAIAREVERLNTELGTDGRFYILIGPGRWGSADHWLGIPVQWQQISNARVIVEASPAGYNVDPSQGTHFFHNLTSLRMGYLTVPPGAERDRADNFVDWEWLAGQPAHCETEHLRHLRLDHPLLVELDGTRGIGLVAREE